MNKNSRTTAILTTRLASLQQLGKGTMTLAEYARLMIPHKLEDGKCFSIEGKEMKDIPFEGPDCIIIDEKLFDQKVATQSWKDKIVSGVNHNLLGPASVQAEAFEEKDDEYEDTENPVPEESEPETGPVEDDESPELSALGKAIAKGKKKKAKALLDEVKAVISPDLFKQLKKQIKEL